MHRWTLQLVLIMFELGLWQYDELESIVNILFQKLENMIILEEKSFKDFETSLINYPEFNKNLKKYFVLCKELVTAICINIVVLMNDLSLNKSFTLENRANSPDVKHPDTIWKDAYFNNTGISNILMRILTKYILRTMTENHQNLFS